VLYPLTKILLLTSGHPVYMCIYIYEEIECGDIMLNNIYEMTNIFNKYLVNNISLTVEDDYARELMMEKYTESQFEAFNVIGVDELKRIVNRLENKSDRRRYNY